MCHSKLSEVTKRSNTTADASIPLPHRKSEKNVIWVIGIMNNFGASVYYPRAIMCNLFLILLVQRVYISRSFFSPSFRMLLMFSRKMIRCNLSIGLYVTLLNQILFLCVLVSLFHHNIFTTLCKLSTKLTDSGNKWWRVFGQCIMYYDTDQQYISNNN